jgi:hypothetical protein
VPDNTTLTPGIDTPDAVCVRSSPAPNVTLLNCTVNAALSVNQTWVYSFPATAGGESGNFTATVNLTKPDDNPANDQDDAVLTVLAPTFRDVAVNITAPPESVLVGVPFNYTVNM